MRILFVIPYYIPAYSYGGPVKAAHDLAKELVKRGHQITVATTDAYDAKARNPVLSEEIDGVKIIRFRNLSNYLAKFFNGYLPLGFRKWLKNNLKNYDLVHCHDFFTYQNILVSKYCQKFNVPYVIQPHGCLDDVRREAKSSKLKELFLNFFPILQNAKHIIALTEKEKESIRCIIRQACRQAGRANDDKKIKIIPNGIALTEFESIEKIDLHKKYNLPKKTKLICFLGRIQYIKGLDISLKALALLRQKLNFIFLIIGPDEGGKNALQKLSQKLNLEQNIIFTGLMEGGAKLETLKSCDLFLFNSRSEGFGLTIIEACGCGIPVIISDQCPLQEIEQYQAGFITPNNPDLIAQKIKMVLTNEKLYQELKTNTQKIIRHFDLQNTVNQFIDLYTKNTLL